MVERITGKHIEAFEKDPRLSVFTMKHNRDVKRNIDECSIQFHDVEIKVSCDREKGLWAISGEIENPCCRMKIKGLDDAEPTLELVTS